MNLGQLKTAVRRYGFSTDETEDPVTLWINAAIGEILSADDWDFREDLASLTTTDGNIVLSGLPSDLLVPITLTCEPNTSNRYELEYYDPRKYFRELNNIKEEGKPEIYTIIGDNEEIRVWPIPDDTYDLELYYLKAISELVNDGDIPSYLPVEHHYTIVFGAAYIALQADNEEDRAQTAQLQFEASLDRIRRSFSSKQKGQPETVQDTESQGDFIPRY